MSDITWSNSTRKLGDLIPWENNPAFIGKDAAKRLEESLMEFGQVNTIAISPDNEIYDGHQRQIVWGASKKFGKDYTVDVRVSSRTLTEKERQKLVIFLRKGTIGEFDWEILGNVFDMPDLLEWGFEKDELLGKGFEMGEGEVPEAKIDKAAELQAEYGTVLGQIWQLGKHRLAVGDCTDKATVDALMQGKKAGAVVTDPPYGIEQPGIPHDTPEEQAKLYAGCLSVMPAKDTVFLVFQSSRLFPTWLDAIRAAGHKFERMLTMYKPNDQTYPWRGWLLKSEAILASSVGKPEWLEVHPFQHDVYSVNITGREIVDGGTKDNHGPMWHGSIKPLAVVQDLVSRVGGIVYDPFLGSGTTLIAAHRLDRIVRGIEISPAYCAVSIKRWEDLTGEKAILLGN